MEVQTHDGTGVTLVDIVLIQASFRPGTIIPMGLVNIAFFCPNQEGSGFIVWKIKRSDRYLPGFVVTGVDEFQRFLHDVKNRSK